MGSRAALIVGATAALLDGILTIIWGRSVVVGALFSCIGLGLLLAIFYSGRAS